MRHAWEVTGLAQAHLHSLKLYSSSSMTQGSNLYLPVRLCRVSSETCFPATARAGEEFWEGLRGVGGGEAWHLGTKRLVPLEASDGKLQIGGEPHQPKLNLGRQMYCQKPHMPSST